MTEADIIKALRERAPVTDGGAKSKQIAKHIARAIFPHYSDGGVMQAVKLMHEHWSPRCAVSWDFETLFDIVQAARQDYDNELAAEAAARDRRLIEHDDRRAATRRVKEADAEAREARANDVRKLAKALNVTLRYSRMLMTEGTSLPERAKQMAAVLGTKSSDHFRQKRKSGREPDLVAWFMSVQPDGCTFRDFARNPPELDDASQHLLGLLRSAAGENDFKDFEEFVARARLVGADSSAVEASSSLWRAFKLWRIDLIASLAMYAVEDTV